MQVVCELEANPTKVNFTWKFNGTNAENIDIPTSDILNEQYKSVATYKPNAENVSRCVLYFHNYGQVTSYAVVNSIPLRRTMGRIRR